MMCFWLKCFAIALAEHFDNYLVEFVNNHFERVLGYFQSKTMKLYYKQHCFSYQPCCIFGHCICLEQVLQEQCCNHLSTA